jgi:septum formation protein
MLRSLSGRPHRVLTGLTIMDSGSGKTISRTAETRVYIKKLSREEIDCYVKTGEPLDKAGAYAIQGLGAVIVEKIAGDYYNVVGLPLNILAEGLKEFGINVLRDSYPATGQETGHENC